MGRTVDVTIPVEPEAAERLAQPGERERIGQMVSRMLLSGPEDRLFRLIAEMKATAQARGLTDEILDEELAAWNAERREREAPPAA